MLVCKKFFLQLRFWSGVVGNFFTQLTAAAVEKGKSFFHVFFKNWTEIFLLLFGVDR